MRPQPGLRTRLKQRSVRSGLRNVIVLDVSTRALTGPACHLLGWKRHKQGPERGMHPPAAPHAKPASFRAEPCIQPQTSRSVTRRRAQRRRASGARRPPASIANRAANRRPPCGVAIRICQPFWPLSIFRIRAGVMSTAPRTTAAWRSQESNRARSRCQPWPSGSRRKSVSAGTRSPQIERLPYQGG